MIVVLINDTVKKYLLKQPPDSRKKTREKFEFLESGIWDGGLKVKKLKGVSSQYVFEARLDKKNRILFTLGRGGELQGKPSLMVYVWGIVSHDDVSKKSQDIIPANAPFLRFTHYDEVRLENIDMDELEPAYFTQEKITEKIRDESGSQKWFSVDDAEWKRISAYSRDDFELFLHLTPEQEEVLDTPLPLMISGTAGSGKTTLSVYYLLNRLFNKKKKLFITYNRHLKDFARKLYHGLLNEREGKEEVLPPDFYTYKELCLEIHDKKFLPGKEVDFERFSQMYAAHPGHHSFDPALVWEEIRSILKGAVSRVDFSLLEKARQDFKNGLIKPGLIQFFQSQFLRFSRLESLQAVDKFVQKYLQTNILSFAARIEKYLLTESPREKDAVLSLLDRTIDFLKKKREKNHNKYLSYFEYEFLGKKKAPNFQFNRTEIYRIFEWYQNQLEKENRWDELDLIPGVVPDRYVYDILACDEIQDFTDTQLELLFNLVRHPHNMFLAGDIRQTINPSGFRWEEVRSHFYERGLTAPGLKMLTLNFRSSGSIVELSNILLDLKEKLTGKKADESREDWKYKGRPVTVVSSIPQGDMLDILKAAGARRTILVRNEPEKEKLKKHLDTELVFTIKEAKGLEFDTVVLWKFCGDRTGEDLWKVILELSSRNIHEAKIKHEINLLYVGITRSQKDLIIYDGPKPSLVWNSDQLKNQVYITDDRAFIEGVWNVVSTPEEWVEQGNYFFERGYFRAAAECYKNGGDEKGLAKARAFHYEKTGSHLEAAVNFEKIDEFEKAARYYEMAREYEKALALWEKLGLRDHEWQCRAEVLKAGGKYREAGQLYREKKKYSEAAACFLQSKDYRQLAEVYHKFLGNFGEAARYYELSQQYQAAADLYARIKSYDSAAQLYEKCKNYSRAESCWKKTKNTKRLLDLYQKTGQQEKLFLIYEQEKELEKAVKHLKALNRDTDRLKEEAGKLFQKKRYFPALVRFTAAGDTGGAGKVYFQLKKYPEAVKSFEAAGDLYSAAQTNLKIKEYEKALHGFLHSPEDKRDHYVLVKAVMRKVKKTRLERIAMEYYTGKYYEPASVLYSHLGGEWPRRGICAAGLGDKPEAFNRWNKCSYPQEFHQIAKECREKNLEETGAEFFLTYAEKAADTNYFLLPRGHRYFSPGFPDDEKEDFEKSSPVLRLVENYFEKNPDPVKIKTWGEYIARGDHQCQYLETVLLYLEKVGQYNKLISYFLRSKIDFYKTTEKEGEFEKELAVLGKVGSLSTAALAFRYLILEKEEELNRALPGVELTPDNFCLYLWGEEAFRHRGFDYCIRNSLENSLLDTLGNIYDPRRIRLAGEYFEYTGNHFQAGRNYEFARDYLKAAGLYERAEKFDAAGDCYFKLKEYEKALAMYQKTAPQVNKKIAQTYEKLKDFESALPYWKRSGDKKGTMKCLKKLEGKITRQQR